jgi:hypothetical protein
LFAGDEEFDVMEYHKIQTVYLKEFNMMEYPKIQTVYLRDPDTKFKTLLVGQYATPEFEFLADTEWVWTEKVDGTNIRVMWDGEKITFGGKTDNAQIPVHLGNALNAMFSADKMREVFDIIGSVCLYGEGYGAKIQKGGGNYRSNQSFVLFDVRVGEWWLKRKDVEDIACRLCLDAVVPIVGIGTLPEMVEFARTGFNSRWGEFPAEGIVAKPKVCLLDRRAHRIITKIKAKDFGGVK